MEKDYFEEALRDYMQIKMRKEKYAEELKREKPYTHSWYKHAMRQNEELYCLLSAIDDTLGFGGVLRNKYMSSTLTIPEVVELISYQYQKKLAEPIDSLILSAQNKDECMEVLYRAMKEIKDIIIPGE